MKKFILFLLCCCTSTLLPMNFRDNVFLHQQHCSRPNHPQLTVFTPREFYQNQQNPTNMNNVTSFLKKNLEKDTTFKLLVEAVKLGKPDIVINALNCGGNVNTQNANGMTVLHTAIQGKKTDIAILLISNGANLSILDKHGNSFLVYAIASTLLPVIEQLVLNGINITTKDTNNSTVLHRAIEATKDQYTIIYYLLQSQITKKRSNFRLIQDWINTRTKQKGVTPLYAAVLRNHENIARLLLTTYKANPNITNFDGKAPLHVAAENGYIGMIQLLLSNRRTNPNLPDNNGQTPYDYAKKQNNIPVLKILAYGLMGSNQDIRPVLTNINQNNNEDDDVIMIDQPKWVCKICYDDSDTKLFKRKNLLTFSCGHIFHKQCWREINLTEKTNQCPTCGQQVFVAFEG